MSRASRIVACTFWVVVAAPAHAASLQVQPASLEILAPGAAATLTLRNDGPKPINVQVRVFRWSQIDGDEHLEPTEAVVASPPAVTLGPNTDYVGRVVRVSKQPVVGEETYRLFVDELPDTTPSTGKTIRLLVRQSIPVFFAAPDRAPAVVEWSVQKRAGQTVLSARNNGDARLRISALTLRDNKGNVVSFGKGLVGYALGHSTMRWAARQGSGGFAAGGSAEIFGQGNEGPIKAAAPILAGR